MGCRSGSADNGDWPHVYPAPEFPALYLIACALILVIHRWSPTGLGGPGLDLFVYVIALFAGVALFARGILSVMAKKSTNSVFIIHIIGSLAMLVIVYKTVDEDL